MSKPMQQVERNIEMHLLILLAKQQEMSTKEIAKKFKVSSYIVQRVIRRIYKLTTNTQEKFMCPMCDEETIKVDGHQAVCSRCMVKRHAPVNRIGEFLKIYDDEMKYYNDIVEEYKIRIAQRNANN